jgi:hypothetical protein
MKKNWYFLILLLAGIFYGCDTETEELGDAQAGKNYYPLEIGNYRIYNVMYKKYEDDKAKDSTNFQIRERIDTIYTNLAGEPTYKIIRSRRATADDFWADDSVITVTLTKNQLVRKEGNLSLVKLIFPVSENKTWSPNVYNYIDSTQSPKPHRARYTNVGQSYTLNGTNYPKTVRVSVNDEETFINIDKREEVYADGIGLIYKNYNVINYCTQQPCNGNLEDFDYKESGFMRIETLDSYGKID